MIIDTEDHGGVANLLDHLKEVYGLQTREQALARGVALVLELSRHADQCGLLHLLDKSNFKSEAIQVH